MSQNNYWAQAEEYARKALQANKNAIEATRTGTPSQATKTWKRKNKRKGINKNS